MDCPQVDTSGVVADQPFDAVSVGESEDGDLVPLQSGEDWIAQLDNDLARRGFQHISITAGRPHVCYNIGVDPV